MPVQGELPFEVFRPADVLSAEEEAILAILGPRRGREAAISVDRLALVTGIERRRVEQVVKQLVEEHQVPIGTSTRPPYGYYIIERDEERREVRDSLIRRAASVFRRARAYDRSGWVARMLGQMELHLGEGR